MSMPGAPAPCPPSKAYKAIYAGAVTGIASSISALTDGHYTAIEALITAGAVLAAAGGVYGITNPPKG